MRDFFGKYSYGMVKMFLNQFAIGLFGLILATATLINGTLGVIAGIFSVLFYLFLIYTMTWEIGAKDRISIDVGKLKPNAARGFLISICANVPNFIIAILYTVGTIGGVNEHTWAGNLCFVSSIVSKFIEGMYLALTTVIKIGAEPIYRQWWVYFVMTIPAIVTAGIAYILGTKNAHFTSMLIPAYPESDREPKKKKGE